MKKETAVAEISKLSSAIAKTKFVEKSVSEKHVEDDDDAFYYTAWKIGLIIILILGLFLK